MKRRARKFVPLLLIGAFKNGPLSAEAIFSSFLTPFEECHKAAKLTLFLKHLKLSTSTLPFIFLYEIDHLKHSRRVADLRIRFL